MNNENNVQMPESLMVMQAQNAIKQLLQAFPLPMYAWRLIIKDLLHEVNDAYLAQISAEQSEYQRRLTESSQPAEASDTSTKKKEK